jgi:hypothetical protein
MKLEISEDRAELMFDMASNDCSDALRRQWTPGDILNRESEFLNRDEETFYKICLISNKRFLVKAKSDGRLVIV